MSDKSKVEILEQRTINELGVAIDKLIHGSHTKIYVKCTRCGEEFKRIFADIHQLHNCPIYRTINNIRHKWCNKCKTFKQIEHFTKHDENSYCKACTNDSKDISAIDGLTDNHFNTPVRCEFKLLDPRAKMPDKKRATDAGLDVYAIEDCTIPPKSYYPMRTGFALVVPPMYYYTIEGRSGYWKHGIIPCRGIIDATYSGEVLITMNNHDDTPFTFKQYDRFAQLIMHRFVPVDIIEVEHIDDSYGGRGAAGFGSSNIKL